MNLPSFLPSRPAPAPATAILDYLQERFPGYPFHLDIDPDFVDELLDDFPGIDVLEQIKAFRWYHDNQAATRLPNLRLAIRRWILKGRARTTT